MLRTVEIAWLAGLIEGEGYLSFQRGSPSIKVEMTDEDVVRRAAAMLGVKATGPYRPKRPGAKLVWSMGVHGYSAIGWMLTLFTFFGERRRQAVANAVAAWVSAPGFARKVRGADGKTLPANCHPDRALHARQMCRQCYGQKYMAEWRKRTGRNGTYYRMRAHG